MMTMGFKAGTGTASRIVDSELINDGGEKKAVKFTVAALVQSNFGGKKFLTVRGVPVGQILLDEEAEAKRDASKLEGSTGTSMPETATKDPEGSIIIVLATDAPLIPIQLQRLAKRGTVGMARSECTVVPPRMGPHLRHISTGNVSERRLCAESLVVAPATAGGFGSNYSGDIFIAFSTAHKIPRENTQSWTPSVPQPIEVLDTESINSLFVAAAEAVEEAICECRVVPFFGSTTKESVSLTSNACRCNALDNALCMATDTRGPDGAEAKAIDLDKLKRIVDKHVYQQS